MKFIGGINIGTRQIITEMNLKGRSVLEQKSLPSYACFKGNQHWTQVNHHRHGFKERSTKIEYIYENLKSGPKLVSNMKAIPCKYMYMYILYTYA